MNGFMQKASAAADSAGKAVKVKAFETEIEFKKGNIKTLQQEFGVKVFDLVGAWKEAEIKAAHAETKQKIDAVEAEIAAKQAEIAQLKQPAAPAAPPAAAK